MRPAISALVLLPFAAALQLPPLATRRGFLAQSVALAAAAPLAASADPDDDLGDELIDVYFGCGCFWQ
jgi:hypothetical protein